VDVFLNINDLISNNICGRELTSIERIKTNSQGLHY